MKSSWETFLERYNRAPKELKDFIDSENIPDAALALKNGIPLESTSIPRIIVAITDIVLEMRTQAEVIDDMAAQNSLEEAETERLRKEIANFIAESKAILPSLPKANLETKERLQLRPDVSAISPEPKEEEVAERPLTRDDLMDSLSAKRTMAGDIAALKGDSEAGESKAEPMPWYRKPLLVEDEEEKKAET